MFWEAVKLTVAAASFPIFGFIPLKTQTLSLATNVMCHVP